MSIASDNIERPIPEGRVDRINFGLLGVDVSLTSDSPVFFEEFTEIFGRDEAPENPLARLEVDLRVSSDDTGRLDMTGDELDDPAGYFLSFSSPTIPIRRIDPNEDGWERIALGDNEEETFRFRGQACEFRKVARWPRILSHLLFLRLLRLRSDLIFFHAGSVSIAGSGTLLIGPKGSGKTTLTLAIASRGWPLLGDETAAYSPSDGNLVPFPRPVAIKPGPRAKAIAQRIDRLDPSPDEEGVFRIPVSDLLPLPENDPVPLRHMIFLEGYGDRPELTPIQPGREHLSSLQPLAASLVNQSPTQRVFQLIRIMSGVSCWQLTAGDPDETAEMIQHTLEDS